MRIIEKLNSNFSEFFPIFTRILWIVLNSFQKCLEKVQTRIRVLSPLEFTLSLKLQCSILSDFSTRPCVLLFSQWVWYSILLGFKFSDFRTDYHIKSTKSGQIEAGKGARRRKRAFDCWTVMFLGAPHKFHCKCSSFGMCGAFHFSIYKYSDVFIWLLCMCDVCIRIIDHMHYSFIQSHPSQMRINKATLPHELYIVFKAYIHVRCW